MAFDQDANPPPPPQQLASMQTPVNLMGMFTPRFGQNVVSNQQKKSAFVFGGSPPVSNLLFQNSASNLLHQYPALTMNLNSQQFQQSSNTMPFGLPSFPSAAVPSAMPQSFPPGFLNMPNDSASVAAFQSPVAGGTAKLHSAPVVASPNDTTAGSAMLHSAASTVTMDSALRQAMLHPAAVTAMHSPLTAEDASQLQLIMSNPQLSSLFMKFASPVLNAPAKPILPWVLAAQQRGPSVQDQSMPLGYKRINVHEIIPAAVEERKRSAVGMDTAKAIKWPVMKSFDEDDFLKTRLEYYECVLSAAPSAMFSTFKSCLATVARNSACNTFHLDVAAWIALPDDTFLNWCALHFGPENKAEAERRLKSVNSASI